MSTASRQGVLTARYETLRYRAVHRHFPASQNGLVVLLRQGVAAWMDAWSRLPAPQPRPVQDKCEQTLSLTDDVCTELIRVLAAMTLGNIREVHS